MSDNDVPKKKLKRGSARMREAGYVQVTLWLDPKEAARIYSAAQKQGEPVATWIRRLATAEATMIYRRTE